MNEPQNIWWNILDTISGVAIGIISVLGAVFGWLSNKFKAVDDRMDAMEKDFLERNQLAAISITQLKAYHEANTQRLSAIEAGTQEINRKLDRLIVGNSNRRKRGNDD